MQTKVLHWVHWSLLWDGVSSQFVPSCLLDRSLLSAVCWKQNLPTDSLIKEEEDWPERYILSSCYFSIPLWQYAIVISSDVLTVFHPGVWEVGGLLRNLTTLGYFQLLFTSFTLGIVLKNRFSFFLSRPWRSTALCSATCLKTSPTKTWNSSSRPARRTSPRTRATTSPPPRSGSATWRRTTSWPKVRSQFQGLSSLLLNKGR